MKVLLVEDDGVISSLIESEFQAIGVCTTVASTFEAGKSFLSSSKFGAVVLDLKLGQHEGTDLLPVMDRTIPVIISSGNVNPQISRNTRFLKVFQKPYDIDELTQSIAKIKEFYDAYPTLYSDA